MDSGYLIGSIVRSSLELIFQFRLAARCLIKTMPDTSQPQPMMKDIASLLAELNSAEKTADALEGRLSTLEKRLDELLGQLEVQEKEAKEPNGDVEDK